MATVFLTHDPDSLRDFYGEKALAGLRDLAQVRINDTGKLLDADALLEQSAGCDLIVADVNTPAEAAFFDRAEVVALLRCAVDTRTIDIDAASRNGILVTNASPGFVDSVSELIFGVMIDLARHVTYAASAYHAGAVPAKRMGVELKGSTIGILGYGSIGTRVAEIARAFAMHVLVCDPFKSVSEASVEQVSMEVLLARADFVVCLVIANAETENLLDAAAFAQMQPGAYFINASRGNLVDEAALHEALQQGRIAGAALDVGRAPGQMPTPELAGLANVIATPHVGGLTPPATQAQALETVEQVRALLSGKLPHNALNAEHAARLERLTGAAR
jgi:D-3-phosphoglycerate dehydrogenase